MSRFKFAGWPRLCTAVASAMTVLMLAAVALAAGRIEWASKRLKPRADGNSWNVELKVYMPVAPNVPTVPMKFEFLPKVYYERSMVDGDKLLTRNVPLEGKQAVIETVDVGFLDPSSAKIESRTKFTFKLHRDHGLDCGEYRVTVRDTRNGQIVGQPINLVLEGENEVIDRRSIVFAGEKKKDKKKEEKKEDTSQDTTSAESADDTAKSKAESAPKEAPANEVPPADEPNDQAGTIKKKPGGCGCDILGAPANRSTWAVLAAVAAGLCCRRRRREG
jgi:hypothetical protein